MGPSIWSFRFGSSFEFGAKETLGCDPSSRVGACGRRPSESADPGCRRVGSFTEAGRGCTVERKLYGGRGLGLVRCPQVAAEVVQTGGLIKGQWRITLRGRFRSPIGSPGGFRRSPGELLRAPGRPKVVKMRLTLDQFELQGSQKGLKSKLRVI